VIPKEIFETIKGRFEDAVVAVVEPEKTGDPWIQVKPEKLVEIATFLRDDEALKFDYCSCVSGVDDTKTFWVVYHLYSIPHKHWMVMKVDAGREDPKVPSVSGVWPASNWHEREAYDLLGIRFEGHPDLRRILLPEDWEGHPLRKDYTFPEDYQGIPLR
jgi:NADH-quinone oxidoreductase subunit C